MGQKRGLAPSPVAIRPQEMDAGEVPVPISEPCLGDDGRQTSRCGRTSHGRLNQLPFNKRKVTPSTVLLSLPSLMRQPTTYQYVKLASNLEFLRGLATVSVIQTTSLAAFPELMENLSAQRYSVLNVVNVLKSLLVQLE